MFITKWLGDGNRNSREGEMRGSFTAFRMTTRNSNDHDHDNEWGLPGGGEREEEKREGSDRGFYGG
jgi:hypothetical protein